MEQWKLIEGASRYYISDLGRVKSFCNDKVNGRLLVITNNKNNGSTFGVIDDRNVLVR